MNTFSERLKKVMVDKQFTQSDLASAIGLGKSSVSQYVSGKNEPKIKTMTAIADVLEVSVEWLSGSIDEYVPGTITFKNLKVEKAAQLMGVGKQMIREGLKNAVFPFGYAVLMPSGRYRYYISPMKFTEHTGIEII